MDATHIDAFLGVLKNREEDKWSYNYQSKDNYWRVHYTGLQSKPLSCTFYIELGPKLMYLHAPLSIVIAPGLHLGVYRYALRLNEEMSGAKIGLSHDGKLSLMGEWPRDTQAFSDFETAIRTLLFYYATYYADIEIVAQDKDIAWQIACSERKQIEEDIAMGVHIT